MKLRTRFFDYLERTIFFGCFNQGFLKKLLVLRLPARAFSKISKFKKKKLPSELFKGGKHTCFLNLPTILDEFES